MHPPPPQPRLCNKGCRIERTPQIRVQRASRKLRTRHQILGIKLSFRVRSLLLLVFFLLFKSYCSLSISSRIVVTFLRFPFPVSMIFLSIHLSTCVFWHPRLHLIWYFAWSCPFRFPVSSWNCSWEKKGERRDKTNRNYALVAQLKLTK